MIMIIIDHKIYVDCRSDLEFSMMIVVIIRKESRNTIETPLSTTILSKHGYVKNPKSIIRTLILPHQVPCKNIISFFRMSKVVQSQTIIITNIYQPPKMILPFGRDTTKELLQLKLHKRPAEGVSYYFVSLILKLRTNQPG